MAASSSSLSFTNMSSATLYQYRGTSSESVDGWKIGYAVSKLNYNLCIKFTPSKNLSKVVFTLTADSATGTCYYRMRTSSGAPGVDWISSGTKFSFSSKKATITLTQTFTAGTAYYLWLGTTNNNYNTCIILYNSGFACSSTVSTYTISYNANGGTGAPASQTKTYGTALTLSSTKPTKAQTTDTTYTVTFDANSGTTSKTSQSSSKYTTYTFSKWNTASDGSGTSYNAGASYTANAGTTLYAQYTTSSKTDSVTLPTASECTRTGYTLSGWSTSSTATSASYSPGASYTPSATITLYAVWKADVSPIYIKDSSGNFNAYYVYIANSNGEFELYSAYIYTNNEWKECIM